MRIVFFFTMSFLLALHSEAQLANTRDQKSAKGAFYVSVDDAATLFVNGTKVYQAGHGQSRSPELKLKAGDRFVVHLREDGGGKQFVVLFASTDGQTVVSFKNRDFKIIPELDVTDFTPEQFQKLTKYAKDLKQKAALPIKSYSESLWGDLDKCILACTVTPQMFSQRPK